MSQAALLSEKSVPLEESIGKVNSQLTQISRMQRYFRTWENRGFSMVYWTQCVRLRPQAQTRSHRIKRS